MRLDDPVKGFDDRKDSIGLLSALHQLERPDVRENKERVYRPRTEFLLDSDQDRRIKTRRLMARIADSAGRTSKLCGQLPVGESPSPAGIFDDLGNRLSIGIGCDRPFPRNSHAIANIPFHVHAQHVAQTSESLSKTLQWWGVYHVRMMRISRRNFIVSASAFMSTAATASSLKGPGVAEAESLGGAPPIPDAKILEASGIQPSLFLAALAALDRHSGQLMRDRIGIVDFAAPSSAPRFHLVNMHDGTTTSLLVAHGSGSDPAYSGWLQRFSNRPGSNATSEGAYATSDYYDGAHGRSQRLIGLDPTNNNAIDRAIVVHGAWYAEPEMVADHGKLGRSQGCFALPQAELGQVFDHLGEGRLIFAGKMRSAAAES